MALWKWNGELGLGANGQQLASGTGSPEGVVDASQGSIYIESVTGALYTKSTTISNTGWICGKATSVQIDTALGNAIYGSRVSITSNVLTYYTFANNLVAGQPVTFVGFRADEGLSFLNGVTVIVISNGLSNTQFSANLIPSHANLDITASAGAVLANSYIASHVNVMANSLTITLPNAFDGGEVVLLRGFPNASYLNDQIVTVLAADATSFIASFNHPDDDVDDIGTVYVPNSFVQAGNVVSWGSPNYPLSYSGLFNAPPFDPNSSGNGVVLADGTMPIYGVALENGIPGEAISVQTEGLVNIPLTANAISVGPGTTLFADYLGVGQATDVDTANNYSYQSSNFNVQAFFPIGVAIADPSNGYVLAELQKSVVPGGIFTPSGAGSPAQALILFKESYTVTHVNVTSNTLTITASNRLAVNDQVQFSLTNATFLTDTYVIATASSTQFTVTHVSSGALFSHGNYDSNDTGTAFRTNSVLLTTSVPGTIQNGRIWCHVDTTSTNATAITINGNTLIIYTKWDGTQHTLSQIVSSFPSGNTDLAGAITATVVSSTNSNILFNSIVGDPWTSFAYGQDPSTIGLIPGASTSVAGASKVLKEDGTWNYAPMGGVVDATGFASLTLDALDIVNFPNPCLGKVVLISDASPISILFAPIGSTRIGTPNSPSTNSWDNGYYLYLWNQGSTVATLSCEAGTSNSFNGSSNYFLPGGQIILLIADGVSNFTVIPISNNSAGVLASIDLTAQTGAIATTTLYAVPAWGAGLYRVTYYAKITTAGTTSTLGGTNRFQVTYTDPTDSTIPTVKINDAATNSLTGNVTTTVDTGSILISAKASTNIQYTYDYTSSGTTMAYKLSIRLEKVS